MERGWRSADRATARAETFSTKDSVRRCAFRAPRAAFTLMEVLIVIALMGIVTAVAVTDFASLLDSAAKPSPFETLRAAVDAGRARAVNAGAPVRLTYDAESGELRVNAGDSTQRFAFDTSAQVAFAMPADEAEGTERALDAIVFHPAGCATPGVIDLTVGGERSRYRLEPFSAALAKEGAR